jgi:antitoxin ParD1/3/4
MQIELSPEQEAWLAGFVARGESASAADALRALIAEKMGDDLDDLAWAKPYVDAARADIARGDVLTRAQHDARMDAVLASLKA